MAIRPILHYPDKRLRVPGEPVTEFDDALRTLVEDMAETMYAAPGVGLAATQLGIAQRIFIIDVASGEDEPSDLKVFINPEILETQGDTLFQEGCLSFPDASEEVRRSEWVRVRAQDEHGETFEMEADGLMAIAIQHENDHLDGKLMIDRISLLRKRRLDRAMRRRSAAQG